VTVDVEPCCADSCDAVVDCRPVVDVDLPETVSSSVSAVSTVDDAVVDGEVLGTDGYSVGDPVSFLEYEISDAPCMWSYRVVASDDEHVEPYAVSSTVESVQGIESVVSGSVGCDDCVEDAEANSLLCCSSFTSANCEPLSHGDETIEAQSEVADCQREEPLTVGLSKLPEYVNVLTYDVIARPLLWERCQVCKYWDTPGVTEDRLPQTIRIPPHELSMQPTLWKRYVDTTNSAESNPDLNLLSVMTTVADGGVKDFNPSTNQYFWQPTSTTPSCMFTGKDVPALYSSAESDSGDDQESEVSDDWTSVSGCALSSDDEFYRIQW